MNAYPYIIMLLKTLAQKAAIVVLAMIVLSCGSDVFVAISDDDGFILVYSSTGAIQCQSTGLSIGQTSQQLIDGGVDVIDSQCGVRTSSSIAVICGAPDITINVHQIHQQNLTDAERLGFSAVSTLSQNGSSGYDVISCF